MFGLSCSVFFHWNWKNIDNYWTSSTNKMYELRFVCNVYKWKQKVSAENYKTVSRSSTHNVIRWHGLAFRLTGQQLSQQMEIINSYGHRSQSPAHRMLILRVNIDYTYLCISDVDYQFDVYADILYGCDWWCGWCYLCGGTVQCTMSQIYDDKAI